MAYYCLECFNQIEGQNLTSKDVEFDMDFCEKCGQNKPCVACLRPTDDKNNL